MANRAGLNVKKTKMWENVKVKATVKQVMKTKTTHKAPAMKKVMKTKTMRKIMKKTMKKDVEMHRIKQWFKRLKKEIRRDTAKFRRMGLLK